MRLIRDEETGIRARCVPDRGKPTRTGQEPMDTVFTLSDLRSRSSCLPSKLEVSRTSDQQRRRRCRSQTKCALEAAAQPVGNPVELSRSKGRSLRGHVWPHHAMSRRDTSTNDAQGLRSSACASVPIRGSWKLLIIRRFRFEPERATRLRSWAACQLTAGTGRRFNGLDLPLLGLRLLALLRTPRHRRAPAGV